MARGDRRLSELIEAAYYKGCLYDSWTDCFKEDVWRETIKELGVDVGFYISRERDRDELFPWDFIDAGVSRSFLWNEYMRSKEFKVTPNCREGCAGCGAASFGCGVCFEEKATELCKL